MKVLLVLSIFLLSAQAFDYFLLAVQWPVSYCLSTTCKIPGDPRKWTIHGLWPTTPTTPYPAYCEPVTYSASAISSIESQLKTEWPTYNPSGDYHDFWEHEWTKHGSCSLDNSQVNTQFKYFDKTLQLHSTYKIASVLNGAGITPSDTKTYTLSALTTAFRNSWGVVPEFDCATINGRPTLMEVRPCFHKSSMAILSCADAVAGEAGEADDLTIKDRLQELRRQMNIRFSLRAAKLRQLFPNLEVQDVLATDCPSQFYFPNTY